MGHDRDVPLPHVPGHELAGVIQEVGSSVKKFKVGDRVTVPFCCGCGTCYQCSLGNTHICDAHSQPGFTHWGAFAEQVDIEQVDINLVALPEGIDFQTAASLGCRFITAFRALVDQARVSAGQWVAIHGCGGVGLSAIEIAKAVGALVIAVDIQPSRLDSAKRLGADEIIDANRVEVVQRIREITSRGADVSIDALGHPQTCWNSIACLAKRGKHVQVGLMLADQASPSIPMDAVIAKELEIYGSHGMQPTQYGRIFSMIEKGLVSPQKLLSDTVSLQRGVELLMRFAEFPNSAMTVIDLTL
jgi:alcohol dehydrogenase